MTHRSKSAAVGILTVLAAVLAGPSASRSESWEERTPLQRFGNTIAAGIVNVVPVTSALVAPKCLPGYIPCKLSFALASVVGAAEQLLMSGGSDLDQTKSIVYRGFNGDWYVKPQQIADGVEPRVLPDPPPPSGGSAPPAADSAPRPES